MVTGGILNNTMQTQHSTAVFEINDSKPEFNPYSTAMRNQQDKSILKQPSN